MSELRNASRGSSECWLGDEEAAKHNDVQNGTPQGDRMEEDKRIIYRHPLFPLLALMFEKCELATQSSSSEEVSATLRSDLELFFAQKHSKGEPITMPDNPEADEIMVKALQVLRIHLLELEKVHELCLDFCNRYITCLKAKMHSENLIRSEGNASTMDDSDDSDSLNSAMTRSQANPHPQIHQQFASNVGAQSPTSTAEPESGSSSSQNCHTGTLVLRGDNQGFQSGSTSENTPLTPEHLKPNEASMVAAQHFSHHPKLQQIAAAIFGDGFDDDVSADCGEGSKRKARRKAKKTASAISSHSTAIMKAWLFQHIMHPYPTEAEKAELCHQTQLTPVQINNWFINARRRVLQPIMELKQEEAKEETRGTMVTSGRQSEDDNYLNVNTSNSLGTRAGAMSLPHLESNGYGISNGS